MSLFGLLAAAVLAVGEPNGPVVVCGDAGAGGYEAFPDVCRTAQGELLCVLYAGYAHVSDPRPNLPRGARIVLCRSQDDGRSWSAPEVVVDTPIDDRDPSIIALPHGELLVTFMTYDVQRTRGTHQVFTVRSRDAGRSWSDPEPTPTPFTQLEAVSSPPRLMPDGRLLMTPYGNHTGNPRSYKHAAVIESRDFGRTWTTLCEIKSDRHLLLEPDLVAIPENRLLLLARPTMVRTESRDGGRTWDDPQEVGIPGDCPYLLLASNHVLVCGIRHRPTKSTSLIFSTDFGKSWQGPQLLDQVLGAYPSLVELPDGRVLVVYYTEGAGSDVRARWFRPDFGQPESGSR